MCRLFAVRAHEPFSVQRAFEALQRLSQEHKDGWGVAHLDTSPARIETGLLPAHACERFAALKDSVASRSLVAHIRLASVGSVRAENSHPFQGRELVFMHNGTVRNFQARRALLEAELHPTWRSRIQGETDSEACFALLLTYLDGIAQPTAEQLVAALQRTIARVAQLFDDPGAADRSAMNFLVTDGERFVVSRRGRTLFQLSQPGLSIVASERLWDGADWQEVPEDSIVVCEGPQRLSLLPLLA